MSLTYYNVEHQNAYTITVSQVTSLEDLGDVFVTNEELNELGVSYSESIIAHRLASVGLAHMKPNERLTRYTLKSSVEQALKHWRDKLIRSRKRTIVIEDQDLLAVLKDSIGVVQDHLGNKYCRRGDRLGYTTRYKRKQTKPTQANRTHLWEAMECGFRQKYGAWLPHCPRWMRQLNLFKAYKDCVGWRRTRQNLNSENAKWCRIIWDNPEEYF
jgi:hypothetical protein